MITVLIMVGTYYVPVFSNMIFSFMSIPVFVNIYDKMKKKLMCKLGSKKTSLKKSKIFLFTRENRLLVTSIF